ncbi:polyamine ABC transporter substrate-binding protein [Marinitenerispora sediminis]|uniref:ABC transporter substrate-binding protein n=1 Tax=Marinitenerispora sediminis TaxID=1931232 RepID=A0A368T570_9ACTN|nr:spermidine/putrescine ABC transporter substrate-binding protein [Marinitenerispora sediminis]RCV50937.1 ABC transporter substrate-binding protein [Marinitenerispora sediminis]RCV51613.1 ABC transporter substrate-binding protein [Marinitenerispora sediminis]RCV54270.1 ABC transporter substrate-binding protein [Marinitenerispora sediminis]
MEPRPSAALALARGLARARIGRRGALALPALAGAAAVLGGCSIPARERPAVDPGAYWADKRSNGRLTFANWPLYMDPDRTPLARFTERTGIRVDYRETIHDTPSFFGQIQPRLAGGHSAGCDLMVLTNGRELSTLLRLGYLAPLDHGLLPAFTAHGGESYRHAPYDPGNAYCLPYASGITGIAYDPERVGREITAIADLWDPAFSGRVGMMRDAPEIANFGLLLNGVAPAESAPADWDAAADRLREQRDAGIVRGYYEQDYLRPLTSGDVWLSMAWSGDVFQQNLEEGTRLRFVIPEEGATIWTDNMVIPITAENPLDAITLMDFLYEPETAAGLTEYIAYVSPVPEARELIRERADRADGAEAARLAELAASPLVFPTEEDYARLHSYVTPPAGEDQAFTSRFLAITQE